MKTLMMKAVIDGKKGANLGELVLIKSGVIKNMRCPGKVKP
jgi:hypothetical protein